MTNSEKTNYRFEEMHPGNIPHDKERTVRCENCFTVWKISSHPNSIKECPHCGYENNSTRRIIFFWDNEMKKILFE